AWCVLVAVLHDRKRLAEFDGNALCNGAYGGEDLVEIFREPVRFGEYQAAPAAVVGAKNGSHWHRRLSHSLFGSCAAHTDELVQALRLGIPLRKVQAVVDDGT